MNYYQKTKGCSIAIIRITGNKAQLASLVLPGFQVYATVWFLKKNFRFHNLKLYARFQFHLLWPVQFKRSSLLLFFAEVLLLSANTQLSTFSVCLHCHGGRKDPLAVTISCHKGLFAESRGQKAGQSARTETGADGRDQKRGRSAGAETGGGWSVTKAGLVSKAGETMLVRDRNGRGWISKQLCRNRGLSGKE